MRLLSLGLFGLALALAPCHGAVAQEWPTRPVTFIVPFPAGAAVIAAELAKWRPGIEAAKITM